MKDDRTTEREYDFVVIGAGAAGEAAAHLAAKRGARTAVIERELVGGSCAFWACMPSKSLLHSAGIHALGGDRPWSAASQRRDWIISREQRDWPDDSVHERSLVEAGVDVVRGEGRVRGPGRVSVTTPAGETVLAARNIVVAVGTSAAIPDIAGLSETATWTNREATSTRELPRNIAILGGGPTGLEIAQVYARYEVPVTLIHPHEQLNQRDHPRNSAAIEAALVDDGVVLRKPGRVERVSPGEEARYRLHLADGAPVEADEILLAVGRAAPLAGLGLETVGVQLKEGRLPATGELRLADGIWVAGDPAGPEMHTHLAHYQGEMVVRMALGEEVAPDYRAIPRAVYTTPEVAGVGLTLDEARKRGMHAVEHTQDLARTAKGQVAESEGHVTIVVDAERRLLLGAFIAGPGASEAIHEAVLAIKTDTPLEILAETLHAFPTTARVMGNLFAAAAAAAET